MIQLLLSSFIVLFSWIGFAEEVKVIHAAVAVDGAAVYARPDFDSEVVDYLNQGGSLPISVKQYPGTGGLGLFHKIKTPSGKIGFVADTDVALPKGAPGSPPPANARKDKSGKTHKRDWDDEDERRHQSVYMTRYIGGSVAMVNYTETFQGKKLSSQTPFFGFRMTGPGTLFNGPPLDINISLWPKPPAYLAQFGQGTASGLLALADIVLLLPITDSRTSSLYYGFGPMLTFSNYTVQVAGQNYASQELRIGVDVDVGYAYRFSSMALRADVKYYIEKSMYLSEMISFQVEY